jgi:DNA polymerase-3 subunit delta
VGKAKKINWNGQATSPVLLISGPEDFLASRVIRALKDKLRVSDPLIEISELDAGEYTPGSIYNLVAPSLFNEPRLLIIRGVERCTDALIEDGVTYLNEITPESTVVFYHSSGVRGKRLLEALRASDQVTEVSVEKITKDAERVAFVNAEFATAGKKVTNAAVRDLCNAFTDDLAELASACSQLMQDIAETIDEKVVDRYYSGRMQTNSFTVIDAALAGNAGEALKLFRHAMGSGADLVPMVSAVAAKIRVMAKVYQNRSVTLGQVGGQAWQLDKARREVASWSEDGLANVIQEVAVCDAASKGAERDADFAMERLLMLIAAKGVRVAK